MVGFVLFLLFTGGSWVLVPISMYLGRTIDHWMRRRMPGRSWLQWLTGVRLWHQAASGKLSPQFLAALLIGLFLLLAAFHWTLHQPWQAWMAVAFVVNALFFVVCPLFIFLEKHVR